MRVDAETEATAARPDEARSHRVRLSVEDTGIGIPEARQAALFEPFAQAETSTARKYGGTGLGLSISQRLAEAMGGTLTVASEEGVGSTFMATIRAVAPPEDDGLSPRYASLLYETHAALDGKQALIVEPRPTSRAHLREVVTRWGMEAQAVDSHEASCAHLQESAVDVVLLSQGGAPAPAAACPVVQALHDAEDAPFLVALTPVGHALCEALETLDRRAVLSTPVVPKTLLHALLQAFGAGATEELPATTDLDPAPTTDARWTGTRILLAEDDAVNQQVMEGMAEELGCSIDVVGTGRAALDALRQAAYDVLFMDVQMPEMDGLEAAETIRRVWPRPERPYVVALTAGATDAERRRCLDAGMDDYISKPVRMRDVIEKLRASANAPAKNTPAPSRSPDATGDDATGDDATGDRAMAPPAPSIGRRSACLPLT